MVLPGWKWIGSIDQDLGITKIPSLVEGESERQYAQGKGKMRINTLLYLKNLITDIHVASVTPTSRFAVERVCEKINFPESKLILEYGPGTGNFTSILLKNMTDHASLIAIERNSSFCSVLKKSKTARLSLIPLIPTKQCMQK